MISGSSFAFEVAKKVASLEKRGVSWQDFAVAGGGGAYPDLDIESLRPLCPETQHMNLIGVGRGDILLGPRSVTSAASKLKTAIGGIMSNCA